MSTACLDLSFVIRYISDRIGNYDKPECLFQWCKKVLREYRPHKMFYADLMRIRVSQKLNRVESLEGFSLMEKLQLVFIFSRPVSDEFMQILKEAKFQIEQDGDNKISRFSTENGSVVRFSDHQPGVKYFQGLPYLQGAENENPASQIPQIKEEPVERIELKLEEIKQEEVDDFMNIGQDVQQPAFNGRINYDELDEQEFVYPGFPQNIKLETPMRPQKRRQNSNTVSVKRVRIERWEWETVASSSDSTSTSSNKKLEASVETSSNSSFTPDSSSLVEPKSNASPQSPPPEVTSTAMAPDEPKIGVMSLVTHIEAIAEYYELKGLQGKASRAIKNMKGSGEDKTLSVAKFNSLIGSLLICIEENLIRQTTTSISLKSLLKILQLYLIRPLGSEAAFELISQKIQEFKNNNDGIPPNLLSECLTNLLIATGFYNQLN